MLILFYDCILLFLNHQMNNLLTDILKSSRKSPADDPSVNFLYWLPFSKVASACEFSQSCADSQDV